MKTKTSRALLFAVWTTALLLTACQTATRVTPQTHTVKSFDDIPIYYDVSGGGDTALVFVHCWTCNHSFWDKQVEHFAQNYKVVRLDLAGHGQSGNGRNQYTMAAFGKDVAAVADALNLQRIVFIGHSMGGPVTVEAAKLLGDRVLEIVGVDTFYTGFPYPKGEKLAEFLKPFEENFAHTSEKLVRSMFLPDTDKGEIERIVGILKGADQKMAISAMTNIFMWTEHERSASLKAVEGKLYNINADPKGENKVLHKSVVLVQGVGHFVPQIKSEAFNRSLDEILHGLM